MRNLLIGIVIGLVAGVMAGASVIAPRLQQARLDPAAPAEPAPLTANSEQPKAESEPKPEPKPSPLQRGIDALTQQRLRVASVFPTELPHLGELAKRLESQSQAMSSGDFEVRVFEPGVLVPIGEAFGAVSSGAVDAVFSSAGHWRGEIPALQLFSSIPFGPEPEEYLAWYEFGGGRVLLEDMLGQRNIHPLLCGAIPQESSGWFRNPVSTPSGFKGLHVRAFGLGAEVLERLGANIEELDAGGILAAFEAGKLDGAEYSLPVVDSRIGFQRFAKYYYFPGWHQPTTLFTLLINKDAWQALPASAKARLQSVCGDNIRHGLTHGSAVQFEALVDLGAEGVEVRRWPDPVLKALRQAWRDVATDKASTDPEFARIWRSLSAFRRDYAIWQELNAL